MRWVGRKLAAAPRAIRIVAIAATVLAVFFAANFVYHVVRKPTEMFFPVSAALYKTPIETWRQYAPLFRAYSTPTITPELLAALAQVESTGNPLANTYWRWRLTWNPFAIYQPASSGVGMYQMTDAAFAEARRYCIRGHAVIENGCSWNGLYTRVVPSHAIELTAVFLDRNVAAILARRPDRPPPFSISRSSPPSFISAAQVRPGSSPTAAFRSPPASAAATRTLQPILLNSTR